MLTATNAGITVASSTSTQEELNQAVGITVEPTLEPSAASAESTQNAETAPESETGEVSESEEQKEKRKGGWQRRIDKLNKKLTERDELLEAERQARQLAEARLAGKPAVAAPTVEGEPKETDFADYRDFIKAQAKWEVRQEMKAQREAEAKESREAEIKEIYEGHRQRILEAQEKYDDFEDTVTKAFKNFSLRDPDAAEAFHVAIPQMKNGPDILYHLATHPEEAASLRTLNDVQVVAEIGHLSKVLSSAKPKEEKSSPDPKPVSAAPAPIKPVSSSTAKSTVDPEKMALSDYIKGRNSGTIR